MFNFELKESLERKFRKIAKKDKPLMIAIYKKIGEIIANTPDTINRYKNLRHDLKACPGETYIASKLSIS